MAATHFPVFPQNMRVDTTTPASPATIQDSGIAKQVMTYASGANKDAHFVLWTPASYTASGAQQMRFNWRTSVTSGNCSWILQHRQFSNGNTLAATPSTAAVVTAAPGTAGLVAESVTPTWTGTAGEIRAFMLRRQTTSDTLAGSVDYLDGVWEVPTDPTNATLYDWFPCQGIDIPASSGATRSSRGLTVTTIIKPQTILLRDAQSDFVDIQVSVPSQVNGAPTLTLVGVANASGANYRFRIDAAAVSAGGSSNPSATTGTAFTVTGPGANAVSISSAQSLPISVTAGQELWIRVTRLGSDAADTATDSLDLLGIGIVWPVSSRNPGVVVLDPAIAASPTTGSMTLAQADNNFSRYSAFAPQSQDTKADYLCKVPTLYATGGTLRVLLTASASGNVVLRVDTASPAVGAASDASLSTGSNTTVAIAANAVSQVDIDVSSGIAASDLEYLRLWRIGTNGSDTLAGTLEILSMQLRTNVTSA